MAKGSTSNYERIRALALASAQRIQGESKSNMLEFPRLQQLWFSLEHRCMSYPFHYDIFAAWSAETKRFCHQLRDQLLWMSWYSAPEVSVDLEVDLVMTAIVEEDVSVLIMKGRTYGDSWKKRGGVGAYMMLCRKFDRIENITQGDSGSSAELLLMRNPGDLLDDIADLRRYLLLVEDEMMGREEEMIDSGEPSGRYVNQD